MPGACVTKPIGDVLYKFCNVTTIEKIPFKVSVIYKEIKLNS
jgi:hypothetical protein